MNFKYWFMLAVIVTMICRSQSHTQEEKDVNYEQHKMASASPNAYTRGTVSLRCDSEGSKNSTSVSTGAIQQDSIVLTSFYKRGAGPIYINNQKAHIGFDIVCVDESCCGTQVTWLLV